MWAQLRRESFPVARCPAERLRRALGPLGAVRGTTPETTSYVGGADRPADLVQRHFAVIVLTLVRLRLQLIATHSVGPGPGVPLKLQGLVHHSDWGFQYLAVRYTERLTAADAVASVSSRGDSYVKAVAESFNRLYKT